MLEIHAFGGLTIQQDEKPVGKLASRKAEALLVYLASTRQLHSREALADLLWDDRSQKQALGNLRVLLSSLRRKLGSYLLIERQHVAFDHESDFRLDTAQFDAILTAIRDVPEQDNPMSESTVAQLRNAVALYRGDFLSGFHVRESRGFEEWALLERERLQRLVINALYDLTTFSFSSGYYKAGIEFVTRLLQLDALHEEAHRQLMLLFARDG